MRSKYCIKCGEQITSSKSTCEKCKATIIEMPISDEQQAVIEEVQKNYTENPPSKIKGCLVTLLILSIMFAIPALITFGGVQFDGIVASSLIVLVFIAFNILIYKHRKNLKYKEKRFYFLTAKSESELVIPTDRCRKCKQLLTPEMIFCPKCGYHIHEDLPVDLSKTIRTKQRSTEPLKPEIKEMMPQQEVVQQDAGQKFCINCGTNVEGKKFCPECGTKTEVI